MIARIIGVAFTAAASALNITSYIDGGDGWAPNLFVGVFCGLVCLATAAFPAPRESAVRR